MTPFRNPENAQQRRYNAVHTRNRVIIEHSFGQLKRRFPILRYGIRLNLERVATCITACFVLHNIAKFLNEPDFDDDEEVLDDDVHDVHEPLTQNELRVQGQLRRNEIVAALV